MANIGCICGNVISDSSNNISYKAWFIRDQDNDVKNRSIADIISFMEAYKRGERTKWIKEKFGEDTDTEVSNDWLITRIHLLHEIDYEDRIFQCEKCNRVLIESGKSNVFASFIGESNLCKNIFNGKFHKKKS